MAPQQPSQVHGGGHSSQGSASISVPPYTPQRKGPYTAWSSDVVSEREIEVIFNHLKNIFGFQTGNMLNMLDHLLVMLDSRSSRMVPDQALLTLHSEYIGGESNYYKWYIASETGTQEQWNEQMNTMSGEDRVRQLALWLLLWGEASQIRFMSECLCFIFKLAYDHFKSQIEVQPVPEGTYLQNIITPLYRYIRDQGYEVTGPGKLVKKEKDHAEIIGYEDINQFFWYRDMIHRIVLEDGQSIIDLDPNYSYLRLKDVKWDRIFVKTYKERRTWIRIVVNFKRIWIIHVAIFWYYLVYNASFLENESKVKWSVAAFGGAISTFIMIIANICEFFFISLTRRVLIHRLLFLLFLLIVFMINSSPIYYIDRTEQLSLKVGMVQFFISLITILMFTIVPSRLFYGPSKDSVFTTNYAHLSKKGRFISIGFWCCVFGCKLVESYFFLSPFLKGSLEAMLEMRNDDRFTGSTISVLAIIFMCLIAFILFLTNTFLWFVIWNIIFSAVRSFTPGRSWQNTFAMIPENICKKILSNEMDVNLVSKIWNEFVEEMHRGHLLSNENVQKLLYQRENDEDSLKPPKIFESYDGEQYYPSMSEAERRFKFFAQSLPKITKDPIPIEEMATFTVITPHYSEKIILPSDEINDENTRVNLLEYLKKLLPNEWNNFKEGSDFHERIWASLRVQTLFRTISFINYSNAIKLLYRVKNPKKSEDEIDSMARRKFKFLISMQRYDDFDEEERKNVDFLLCEYPDLHIAYLEKVPPKNERDEPKMYSVLINGYCKKLSNGKREPIYRIQLPGNPILGDGKSDNQNHAIIFYRGEYIQLIDANQENYFEECLKIPNILREFEQYDVPRESEPDDFSQDANQSISQPLVTTSHSSVTEPSEKIPIAIVGAAENIFTKNYGALGDIIAGKGQAFGNMTQSTMAKLGGRLHYGHPDFLNAIFMTTRGGISKAQKGLHLNEDIYAGMNSFNRGGRVKHLEYVQYGKGRDLSLETIRHFTTKTSTGMGEQMLSREYFYYGEQLSFDRLLTFYYSHPGLHVNDIFIMLLVQLLIIFMMFVGAISIVLPDYNLTPIIDWIKYSIISIIFASSVDFLLIFSQEWMENGLKSSIIRLGKHLISLTPLFFEVFIIQIYSNSIITNLNFGGARYIGTGRGFDTERNQFYTLYSRFAGPSIYLGMRIFLILIFVSLKIWIPHLVYFWVVFLALCISPFLYNPHQFSFSEFIIDYREFLRWMFRENLEETRENSWIGYCRISMTLIPNYKLGYPSENLVEGVSRPHCNVIILTEILPPLVSAALCIIVFMFVDSATSKSPNTALDAVIYLCNIALRPILMNAIVLGGLSLVSLCLRLVLNGRCDKFGIVIAGIARIWAIINLIVTFKLLWKLENAILITITIVSIQRFVIKLMKIGIVLLSRDYKYDETNRAWWTGTWRERGLSPLQIFREYIYKIIEINYFVADFILGHIILFMLAPICLIPWIDKWHFVMLFWLKPDEKIRPIREQNQNRDVMIYGILLFIMFAIFAGLIWIPTTFLEGVSTRFYGIYSMDYGNSSLIIY